MLLIDDILNISVAILIGWSCSLVGVFLVLRKMVMVGDAISHSVLPGVVLAYLVSANSESIFMLIGAAVFGVLTTLIIDFLYKALKLQEDASIGLTFTWLFAVGVLLISLFTDGNADIDQECVLFGELGLTFLDKIIIDGKFYGTRSLWKILPVFILIAVVTTKGFKAFQLLSFQSDYADAKGISSSWLQQLLMVLVSLVTVFSFESVGAVLVVGFLVIPPATAYLLTHRLAHMHIISLILVTIEVILGYCLAVWFDVSYSPMIVLTAGLVFFLTFILKSVFVTKRKGLKYKGVSA